MTRDDPLRQRLAEWRPPAGRQELLVPDNGSGWRANLTVDRCDEVGCLVWELTLRRSQAPPNGGLPTWAERLPARVTGLLEPLVVVEIDAARQLAQLRSQTPLQREGKLFYYEVLLEGTHQATVRRYEAAVNGNGQRTQVAFALTHEVLAKLAADLTAAA